MEFETPDFLKPGHTLRMAPPIILAHMSDVHLAPISGFAPRYWNVKRALGYINWQRGRIRIHQRRIADLLAADIKAQAVDHIAVSGDLANIGLPEEYRAARRWLEQLGPPDRVSVVPGNHDIYTGRMHGASCLDEWAAYMTSDAALTQRLGPGPQFPFLRRIGNVALIGVNSAVPTPPFVATGHAGSEQIAALARDLAELKSQGLARVVMIHHPPLPGLAPKRRALDDAAELTAMLERSGAELVLHGHNHTDTLNWLKSGDTAIPVSGAASGSAAIAHGDEPLARYALFRFDFDDGGRCRIERITRGLTHADGAVVEIDRRILNAPVSV